MRKDWRSLVMSFPGLIAAEARCDVKSKNIKDPSSIGLKL